MIDWFKKKSKTIYWLERYTLNLKTGWKYNRWEKIRHANTKHMKTEADFLTCDKMVFKTNGIIRDKEGPFITFNDDKRNNVSGRWQLLGVCVLSHSVMTATPWTVAHQALLVRGIFQARILEGVAISSSRGSSQPRDQACVSCISQIGRQANSLPIVPPGKPCKYIWPYL